MLRLHEGKRRGKRTKRAHRFRELVPIFVLGKKGGGRKGRYGHGCQERVRERTEREKKAGYVYPCRATYLSRRKGRADCRPTKKRKVGPNHRIDKNSGDEIREKKGMSLLGGGKESLTR